MALGPEDITLTGKTLTGGTLSGVALGTPASGTLSNCSGLPSTGMATGDLTIGTGGKFTAGTIELGAASDTTIARSGAGAITVEGVQVILSGAALGTPASGVLTNCTSLPPASVNTGNLSIGTAGILTAGTIELGAASDTTLSRSAAGQLAVEGKPVITQVKTIVFITGAAQTYTPTTGTQYIEVWVTGQGGGGGGARGSDATSQANGSGGGAGGTAYAVMNTAELGANAVYTVGTAAGAGGSNTGGNGTAGTDSSFNPAGTFATLVGTGGALGTGLDNATPAVSFRDGGNGGVPTGGLINYIGGDGGIAAISSTAGTTIPIVSGHGGASYWGGGPRAVAVVTAVTTAGRAGQAYGSGGSGAASLNASAGSVGGAGAVGIIVIKEYIA